MPEEKKLTYPVSTELVEAAPEGEEEQPEPLILQIPPRPYAINPGPPQIPPRPQPPRPEPAPEDEGED